MTRCLRCNEPTRSPRSIALRDFSESRAMYHEGRLCTRCWEIVAGEIVGFDVDPPTRRGEKV